MSQNWEDLKKQSKYLVQDKRTGKVSIAFEDYAKKLQNRGYNIISKEGEKSFSMVQDKKKGK